MYQFGNTEAFLEISVNEMDKSSCPQLPPALVNQELLPAKWGSVKTSEMEISELGLPQLLGFQFHGGENGNSESHSTSWPLGHLHPSCKPRPWESLQEMEFPVFHVCSGERGSTGALWGVQSA